MYIRYKIYKIYIHICIYYIYIHKMIIHEMIIYTYIHILIYIYTHTHTHTHTHTQRIQEIIQTKMEVGIQFWAPNLGLSPKYDLSYFLEK